MCAGNTLYITCVGDVANWRFRVSVVAPFGFVAEPPTSAWICGSIPTSCDDVHALVCVVAATWFVVLTMVVGVNCASLKLRRLGNSWNDVDEGLGLQVFDLLETFNLHLHRFCAFQNNSYAYSIFMEVHWKVDSPNMENPNCRMEAARRMDNNPNMEQLNCRKEAKHCPSH